MNGFRVMKSGASVPIKLVAEFSRFATIGAVGTATHYLVLIVLVSGAGLSAVISTSAGAVLGALINYWLNRRFTFASAARHRQALPRFLAMAAVGLALNGAIVGILTTARMHYLVAQVVATATVLLANYIVSRIWVFRVPKG